MNEALNHLSEVDSLKDIFTYDFFRNIDTMVENIDFLDQETLMSLSGYFCTFHESLPNFSEKILVGRPSITFEEYSHRVKSGFLENPDVGYTGESYEKGKQETVQFLKKSLEDQLKYLRLYAELLLLDNEVDSSQEFDSMDIYHAVEMVGSIQKAEYQRQISRNKMMQNTQNAVKKNL